MVADAGTLWFGGHGSFIDIPVSNFDSSSNRSVSLQFWPKPNGGRQVLYKEGGAASGMSIYLEGSTVWTGIWNQPQEQFIELGSIVPGQWQSVTATFNGSQGRFSGYLFKDNVRVAATHEITTITTLGDSSFRTTFGGSDDATRFWEVGGAVSVVDSNQYFRGFMDDLQVYNRELSAVASARLARADLPPFKAVPRTDSDSDGTFDLNDAFPLDSAETVDTDDDGIGNVADPGDRHEVGVGKVAPPDDDNDGMSDADENLYEFNPLDPDDADADADLDGMSNGDEIFSGTHPVDSNSLFAITVLDPSVAPTSLQWMSVSGRTYFVEYSDDLVAWQLLPGAESILAVDVETTANDTNVLESTRFYRAGIFSD